MNEEITPRAKKTGAMEVEAETQTGETGNGLSPWFTFDEAANYLKLNSRTLRNYVSKGMIPIHTSITNTKRFYKKDLDQWMFGPASDEV